MLANFRVEWVSSPYLYIKIIDVLSSQHEKMQCLQAGSGDRAQDGRATVASERWFENSGELGVTIGNVLPRLAVAQQADNSAEKEQTLIDAASLLQTDILSSFTR